MEADENGWRAANRGASTRRRRNLAGHCMLLVICVFAFGSMPASGPFGVKLDLERDVSSLRSLRDNRDLKGFLKRAEELEESYRKAPADDYSSVVWAICANLSPGDFGPDVAGTLLGGDAFARRVLGQVKDLPLDTRFVLLGRLQFNHGQFENAHDWSDQKRVDEVLLAWRDLQKAIDPKFNPDTEVPLNLSVLPPGPPDSLIGKAYEDAVKENNERTARINWQMTLRTLAHSNERLVVDRASSFYAASDLKLGDIRITLQKAEIDARTIETIAERIATIRGGRILETQPASRP
jgi:hypothetical protein